MNDPALHRPAWPVVSLSEARALLTRPPSRFETEELEIRGIRTKVWKHAPATLRDVFLAGQAHADRCFIVYEGERVSFAGFSRAALTLGKTLVDGGVNRGDRVV